jgi:hypothetical protein
MIGAWLPCVALLAAAGTVAAGDSAVAGENLLFAPPDHFKVGYRSDHDNSTLTESVPDGETVEQWSKMLTVQVFRLADVDAPVFLERVGARYMKDCPGTTARGVFTGHVNGYVVSMLLLRCPHNHATGQPETTAFRVIRGKDALYSVQFAWRAVPSSGH